MKNVILLCGALLAVTICVSCSASKQLQTYSSESIDYGYGSTKKDANTYAINQMNPTQQEMSSYTNIYDYLRGRVPGVQVGPGANPTIRIRGVSSVNSGNDPMFILDGVEIFDISNINPNDIDSITVLKDASASMYGVRGANGVIIIKTRRN